MISVLVVGRPAAPAPRTSGAAGERPGTETVGEAENGAEAVRRIKELRPGVVLMVIQMPSVDGIEATRCGVVAGGGRGSRF